MVFTCSDVVGARVDDYETNPCEDSGAFQQSRDEARNRAFLYFGHASPISG